MYINTQKWPTNTETLILNPILFFYIVWQFKCMSFFKPTYNLGHTNIWKILTDAPKEGTLQKNKITHWANSVSLLPNTQACSCVNADYINYINTRNHSHYFIGCRERSRHWIFSLMQISQQGQTERQAVDRTQDQIWACEISHSYTQLVTSSSTTQSWPVVLWKTSQETDPNLKLWNISMEIHH